jgi:MGT family glycosyltransferase
LGQVTSFFEENRPDLLVYDLLAFSGRILANRWNIPAIQTSPTFAHSKDVYFQQAPRFDILQFALEASKKADRYLEHHGISNSDFLFHREGLNIYLFPKALQPNGNTLDDRCFFAGRCAGEQPYYGNWRPPISDGRPIALIATSTTYVQGPAFFRMCVEAFAALKWRVIVSIGENGDPKDFGTLPPNVEIVQHVAHVRILPYVSLFICLAGIITSAEAMYHGIPLIATTLGIPENEWEAENLVDLGLAIHIRKDEMSVERIRRSVVQITSDTAIQERVKKMQRLVLQEPGAEETSNRIEDYLDAYRGISKRSAGLPEF